MITILILSLQTHPTHNASEVKTTESGGDGADWNLGCGGTGA